jgi:hypothetical protein
MGEVAIIFVIGLLCGILASQLRLRRMRIKVRLYESYIHRRLGETLPFIGERIRSHEAERPSEKESLPAADQRR